MAVYLYWVHDGSGAPLYRSLFGRYLNALVMARDHPDEPDWPVRALSRRASWVCQRVSAESKHILD
jgi:hypothetical protein